MKKLESLQQLESHFNVGTKFFKYAHKGRIYNMRDLTLKKTSVGRILSAIKRDQIFVSDYDAAKLLVTNEQNQ